MTRPKREASDRPSRRRLRRRRLPLAGHQRSATTRAEERGTPPLRWPPLRREAMDEAEGRGRTAAEARRRLRAERPIPTGQRETARADRQRAPLEPRAGTEGWDRAEAADPPAGVTWNSPQKPPLPNPHAHRFRGAESRRRPPHPARSAGREGGPELQKQPGTASLDAARQPQQPRRGSRAPGKNFIELPE